MLPQSILNDAVFDHFVGKEEKDAIIKSVDKYLNQTQKTLAQHRDTFDGHATRKEQEAAIEALAREQAGEASGGSGAATSGGAAAGGAAPEAAGSSRSRADSAPGGGGGGSRADDLDLEKYDRPSPN